MPISHHVYIEIQKPLMLHGHERSITQIKYNRDGDLLFSSAKDNHPCVWYSINGERLGTYEGHQGVVWAIDVDWETKRFMSGAGDNMLMIWDVQTGKGFLLLTRFLTFFTFCFSFQEKHWVKLKPKLQYVHAISVTAATWLYTLPTVRWVTLQKSSSLMSERWIPPSAKTTTSCAFP